jgi:hypothetical protein
MRSAGPAHRICVTKQWSLLVRRIQKIVETSAGKVVLRTQIGPPAAGPAVQQMGYRSRWDTNPSFLASRRVTERRWRIRSGLPNRTWLR